MLKELEQEDYKAILDQINNILRKDKLKFEVYAKEWRDYIYDCQGANSLVKRMKIDHDLHLTISRIPSESEYIIKSERSSSTIPCSDRFESEK